MTEPNGYNMHHGTVLWGLARHYLYSGDREWLLKAAPHMIRAANWIIEQRAQTKLLDENGKKVTHYGLVACRSVLKMRMTGQFWYATNAYACMGMESMAKAFEKAGLPEADFIKREAEAYHKDIRQSIESASEICPVVRLRNNTYVPYVPSRPISVSGISDRKKQSTMTGITWGFIRPFDYPLPVKHCMVQSFLLKAGLITPDEPMAGWVLDDWEDNLTLSSS